MQGIFGNLTSNKNNITDTPNSAADSDSGEESKQEEVPKAN